MQKGIALIQVLILSTVLSVVLLSMNFQAREHLKLAAAVNQYVDAELQLQSAQAEVVFTMLTSQWSQLSASDINDRDKVRWNFHGKDFDFSGVTLNIQDTSGLINLSSPDINTLILIAGDKSRGLALADAIADWQDEDDRPRLNGAEQEQYAQGVMVRNSAIQFAEELQLVRGVDKDLYRTLLTEMSFFTRGINVNQQSDALIRLYHKREIAEEIIRLRDQNQLRTGDIERLTGEEINEFSRFGIGPVFRIRFTAKATDVKLSRELTMLFSPYQPTPVELYEFRTRNPMLEPLNDGF
jgi:general secretion pathway protein K